MISFTWDFSQGNQPIVVDLDFWAEAMPPV